MNYRRIVCKMKKKYIYINKNQPIGELLVHRLRDTVSLGSRCCWPGVRDILDVERSDGIYEKWFGLFDHFSFICWSCVKFQATLNETAVIIYRYKLYIGDIIKYDRWWFIRFEFFFFHDKELIVTYLLMNEKKHFGYNIMYNVSIKI